MTYRLRNIVIAIALASLAALLTSFYVASYKRSVISGEETVPVVVAAKEIPAGMSGADAISRDLFTTTEVARRNVVPGAVSSPDQVRELVATEAIYEGEQITVRRFHAAEAAGIRAELKGNMRALQVPGDANQLLAGTLQRGDRVDVVANVRYKVGQIASTEAAAGGDTERVASRVVLRDLLVLRAASAAPSSESVASPTAPDSVQLAVTDAQAQKLLFVIKNGDWSLQLRPAIDAADSPESVETIESVLGDGLSPNQFRQLYAGRGGTP
ncbi:MAG TPA: Flp pilus assembly protein CpaB [Gaiellaceae bacterium]|jgi:Flp pilus assembly protein CpaB|nr:Flp pilus assembly protein CpaB [Gaiellaceae bacterium]